MQQHVMRNFTTLCVTSLSKCKYTPATRKLHYQLMSHTLSYSYASQKYVVQPHELHYTTTEHMNKLDGLFTTELCQTFYTMITGKHSGSTIVATVIGIRSSSSGVVQSPSNVCNSALSSFICKVGKQGCTCSSQRNSPGPLGEGAGQPTLHTKAAERNSLQLSSHVAKVSIAAETA